MVSYLVQRIVPIWSKPVTSRNHRWHFPAQHLRAMPDRGRQESDTSPVTFEKSTAMVGSVEKKRLESRNQVRDRRKNLSHLTSKDYEIVYEPAEDTFLLLDALEENADELKALRPTICLEIGSGSGCVSAFVGHILGPSVLYLSTDVNPHACHCTRATGVRNNVTIECINGSLASSLFYRLKHIVDILIFNPPYVPTLSDESSTAQTSRGIEGAWAGGDTGMEITNSFLEVVSELLSPKGYFYLVALKANDIDGIRQKMLTKFNLQSEIALERRAGREHLFIIRFSRN